jgi:hypothetical protein
MVTDALFINRPRNPTPSTVSAVKVTAERVMYRASRRRSSEDTVQQKLIKWYQGGNVEGSFYWPARRQADAVVAGLALVSCCTRAAAVAAVATVATAGATFQHYLQERM